MLGLFVLNLGIAFGAGFYESISMIDGVVCTPGGWVVIWLLSFYMRFA